MKSAPSTETAKAEKVVVHAALKSADPQQVSPKTQVEGCGAKFPPSAAESAPKEER